MECFRCSSLEADEKWLRPPPIEAAMVCKCRAYHTTSRRFFAGSRGVRAVPYVMRSFEEYFSEKIIIEELCRARMQLASSRHAAAFFHNIARTAKATHRVSPPAWGHIPVDIFPPRREWHRFRPKRRNGIAGAEAQYQALLRAVTVLRAATPDAPWVKNLQTTIDGIRKRVLSNRAIHFRPPTILAERKEPNGHRYRPLAVYPLEDKIIEGLTARYLRTNLDFLFHDSCMAFRCGAGNESPPTTHDALDRIMDLRSRYQGCLYVAECDIMSFYDCVGHAIARRALRRVLADAKHSFAVSPRAVAIFDAYIESYAFSTSVLGKAQRELKKKDSQGQFKWPKEELEALYSRRQLPGIGVPQGGALSCLVANAVLHEADKRVQRVREETGIEILYMRYCDDMVLVSPERAVCERAFNAYTQCLAELLLPAHPPKLYSKYSREFWGGKSKFAYEWSCEGIRWIQFVGYQIRYDGVVRIRPQSINKQIRAVTKVTDRLVATLRFAQKKQAIRRTLHEVVHRFRHRLIAMSVGRVVLGRPQVGPLPMSWAAGFRGLEGRTVLPTCFKALDRHREREVHRIKRALADCTLPMKNDKKKTAGFHRYYGRPFSYWNPFST